MDLLFMILQKAINYGATDIHLAPYCRPAYRIQRKLEYDESSFELSDEVLKQVLDYFYEQIPRLKAYFTENKQVDFSYSYNDYRFRINVSLTKGVPSFSLRLIPNGEINLDSIGIKDIVEKMRKINSGLVLVTGKVNSGKSTTLNAYLQEVNKELNKKIVTIEDPIEYEHVSNKSIIVQKEVGSQADVHSFQDALINLLREDADIAIVGEIRNKETMNVALDLAESGGLVLGTLHTRSCGETIDRIINMYEPADQMAIKNSLSSVIKLVISQKLLVGKNEGLVLVPEIMKVNSTIAAQIRQEKFSISEIEDTIHASRLAGCKSFEISLSDLYVKGLIDMKTIKECVDADKIENIKSMIINAGGALVD